ncbi:MAG: transposase [Myxococcota bacterium]
MAGVLVAFQSDSRSSAACSEPPPGKPGRFRTPQSRPHRRYPPTPPDGRSPSLGRISKRGDPYLRMLLIHGARSVLAHAKRTRAPRGLRAWALDRERAQVHNKAAVALANKLARIAWAVWRNEQPYTEKEPPASNP